MQLTFVHAHKFSTSKTNNKSENLNISADTLNSSTSSTQSLDTVNDYYYQYVAKWILSYNKKISRDTQYLALSYLKNLRKNQTSITQQNYQQIAVVLLLLASKMNEICPPKILQMLLKCKNTYNYQDIISLQGYILNLMGFQTALDSHVYAFINRVMIEQHNDKIQECEKLLRIVSSHIEYYDYQEYILGYAIMYLIIPDLVKNLRLQDSQKIKTLAIKIYSMYTECKRRFYAEKRKEIV